MKRLRLLDLFSGIGGFSLGLERSGGFRTVAFCEIEPYCQRVLAKHWPEVPCYDDISKLSAERLAADGIHVDAICGGFPCQDISLAKVGGLGLAGERSGLWAQYSRLIGEIRPKYVVVENVSALLIRGFGDVLRDLASLGYDAEWSCIPAGAVGATTIRDRVWIAAYPMCERLERRVFTVENARRSAALVDQDVWDNIPEHRGNRSRNGLPHFVERITGYGNAVVPQIPEMIGRAIMESSSSLDHG